MAKKKAVPTKIFQFKITLKDAPLPIWRRIEVADNEDFEAFHEYIQSFMGWYNCHLHHFYKGRNLFIVPQKTDFQMGTELLSKKTLLSDMFKAEKDKLNYEYDFGDSWNHEIVLEKILEVDATKDYPLCVAGKGKCPPEDCGGVWGYADLLEILKDPKHEEYEDMCEWLDIEKGSDWDPKEFNLEDYR